MELCTLSHTSAAHRQKRNENIYIYIYILLDINYNIFSGLREKILNLFLCNEINILPKKK